MARMLSINLPLILICLAGCSSDEPEIVRVSGTVTKGGKPVPNLVVWFQPEGGRPSWGETNAQGKYDLDYDPQHRGARVGKHSVSFKPGSGGVSAPGELGTTTSAEQREILKKYGSADSSTLTVEVKKDGQVIDLAVD